MIKFLLLIPVAVSVVCPTDWATPAICLQVRTVICNYLFALSVKGVLKKRPASLLGIQNSCLIFVSSYMQCLTAVVFVAKLLILSRAQ